MCPQFTAIVIKVQGTSTATFSPISITVSLRWQYDWLPLQQRTKAELNVVWDLQPMIMLLHYLGKSSPHGDVQCGLPDVCQWAIAT